MEFKDKVVVITGGAHGIGLCTANEFKKLGAKVYVIDIVPGNHFVGDIGICRNAGAQCQDARVKIGSIAQVGKHMLFSGEGLLPDPGDAFATHVAEGFGVAVHPDSHVMTTDAGQGP